VRLLLDTHAFLWWLADSPKLAKSARSAISDPSSVIWISAVSVWEISIKKALGKLQIDSDDLVQEISDNGFIELSISARHAVVAGNLPRHHDDPFDRMLIAQAQTDQLLVVTHDSAFESYGVQIVPT
jgi:PIN domain nuclease of toxin-antitoxin system